MGSEIIELFGEYYLVWCVLLLFFLYYVTTYNHGFWGTMGVPFTTPVPLFGNAYKYILMISTSFETHQELYRQHKSSPFCGFYEFFRPVLMIRDPQLVEQIMIKDFGVWMNRGEKVDPKVDPLAYHLVNLEGSKWRSLRNKLAPVFTSGKLKGMLDQIVECSDAMLDVLVKDAIKHPTWEMKKLMSGFTMDVIGSCAFGLELNVLKNPDSAFMNIGEKVFQPSIYGKLKRFIRTNFPTLVSKLYLKSIPKKFEDFIITCVKDTVKHREENNINRNDFIQLMMELRKQEAKLNLKSDEVILDDVTFAANAFVFLLAGYETTATTLSYIIYEVSKKPDIQEKLYNETQEVLKKHKGEITWETLKDLTYMEQCICETLRKRPPVGSLRRINLQNYQVPNSSLELPAGTSVMIPVFSLHHDPQYFPNPGEFIPERFSEEDKDRLIKGTYLPFGDGPRVCIGARFAKVEIKVAMMKLISNFTFKLNHKTLDPLQYSPTALLSAATGGIWIDITPRKQNYK